MRIVFVIGNAFQIFGGAAISTLDFLRRLERDFGHRCLMLSRHPVPRRETIAGIEVAAYRDLDELKETVRRFQPDVMLGALANATDALRVARRYRIPGFVHLHSYEFCAPTADEQIQWGLAPETVFPPPAEADFVLRSADGLFACSRHMQRRLEQQHGRRADVLYCDFAPEEVLLDAAGPRRPEYISGICGYRHKGLEVLLHLAGKFPHQRFLLAGALGTDIDLSYRTRLAVLPNLFLPGRMPIKNLLGRSKIVLVPSLWPEPFGRIAVEAMANGIPILASYTGGLQEILRDGPMALGNFSDLEAWETRLRDLLESEELRAHYAAEGKMLARPFFETHSTVALELSLRTASAARKPDLNGRKIVAFCGDNDRDESDALVNLRWSEILAAKHPVAPSFRPSEFDVPDFIVHHDYKRHFTEFVPPDGGVCIAVRTSDFGPYPPAWAAKINAEFDQLWVHTRWIREQAIASGIDPERIRLVPLGIDPAIFRPDGPVYPLATKKSFRFLFVGTAVVRKGFDILLEAYRRTFSRQDDVCLVVKDHSGNAFYSATYQEEIRAMLRDAQAPEILYLDEFEAPNTIASLFRACHVGVFPYRAEGFCLPILEAMACGTPSMVPNRGACVDFCSDETSFLLPALRIKLPVNRRFSLKIGVEEEIAAVDFCEIRVETLMRALKETVSLSKEQLKRKSLAGIEVAHNEFTWERSAAIVARLIEELAERGPAVRLQNRRREAEKAHKRFAAAQRLLVEALARRAAARADESAQHL
ncbi:MAG TPA: glycosyltransferase family 4 protein [Candidatus Binatia bacterium]|jgi:glycosyltransferase involved in cell wall biosynthesis